MDWAARYQSRREQAWPEVERTFNSLPPHLYRQGILLKNNLAAAFSATGRFQDILCREHDYPLLYLHFWLLDDLGVAPGPDRAEIEQALFLAMLFSFAAGYTRRSILDGDTFFDERYLFLAEVLTRQAAGCLGRLFPAGAPFWAYYRACWDEVAEAWLEELEPEPPAALPDPARTAARLAPARLPLVAVALRLGRADLLPSLLAMIDGLNQAWQVRLELAALRRDLQRGRLSYPIARALAAAGLPLSRPVRPEAVLGSLALSGVMEEIGRECLEALANGRAEAVKLALPTFAGYFDLAAELVRGVVNLFDLRPRPPGPALPARLEQPFFLPAGDSLAKAAEMAEGYLLADLTFRESWEVHRRGLFGRPEVVARFPAGLVLEILCAHGHDLAGPVDEFFQALAANAFRYYDPPGSSRPDTDSLGVLLRLLPYAGRPEAARALLAAPLAWLRRSIRPDGRIPVWLDPGEVDAAPGPPAIFLGDACAAIEANLLLGLLAFDPAGWAGLIERPAGQLLERLARYGPGATVNYPPAYAAGVGLRLIDRLAAGPLAPALSGRLAAARAALLGYLEAQRGRRAVPPQEAALLALAGRAAGEPGLVNPAWLTVLLKSQSFDGGWPGEPLFFAPNRGELMTWHASRTLTTAFCYAALQEFRRERGGRD